VESILEDLDCPKELMQAQEAPNSRVRGTMGGGGGDDLYSYRRGDIPIFNFDDADRILIATLQELIEALKKLKEETYNHRTETTGLKTALQECKACRIKRPECSDDPPPCFPMVDCRDTADGPVCGPCPPGYDGDGRFCERNVCAAEQPCYRGVQCFEKAESPYFKCAPCPPGYRGDGIRCMPDACQAKPTKCFRVRK
jgi:thrombospondin 2/3/4/5